MEIAYTHISVSLDHSIYIGPIHHTYVRLQGWYIESGAHVPEGPLMHPPYTRSTFKHLKDLFFRAEAPYDRERSSFAYRRTPWSTLHVCEGPSSIWSTFFTLEGPWGSLKDLMVLRRTLKDLYFLECRSRLSVLRVSSILRGCSSCWCLNILSNWYLVSRSRLSVLRVSSILRGCSSCWGLNILSNWYLVSRSRLSVLRVSSILRGCSSCWGLNILSNWYLVSRAPSSLIIQWNLSYNINSEKLKVYINIPRNAAWQANIYTFQQPVASEPLFTCAFSLFRGIPWDYNKP